MRFCLLELICFGLKKSKQKNKLLVELFWNKCAVNMTKYKLISEILVRSQADEWADAKLEWLLHEVYAAAEPQTCLCGHFPIVEICVLKNKENQRRTRVGNCCVKKFMGLPSHLIFQAIKRVNNDRGRS